MIYKQLSISSSFSPFTNPVREGKAVHINKYSSDGNTARDTIVEVPETRFLQETGFLQEFLIFADPSSIASDGIGVAKLYSHIYRRAFCRKILRVLNL